MTSSTTEKNLELTARSDEYNGVIIGCTGHQLGKILFTRENDELEDTSTERDSRGFSSLPKVIVILADK